MAVKQTPLEILKNTNDEYGKVIEEERQTQKSLANDCQFMMADIKSIDDELKKMKEDIDKASKSTVSNESNMTNISTQIKTLCDDLSKYEKEVNNDDTISAIDNCIEEIKKQYPNIIQ